MTKFLITTGSVFTSGTNKSELIDLESANNVCPSFSEYPLKVVYATGGLLQEQPIICGGEYLKDEGNLRRWIKTDKCYKLTQNGFENFATMTSKRTEAARLQDKDIIFLV